MLTAERQIASSFEDIAAVEQVFVERDGDVYAVFTIIDDEDDEAIDSIYSRERMVIEQHPGLHFDFNVIARRGRPLESVLTLGNPAWLRIPA